MKHKQQVNQIFPVVEDTIDEWCTELGLPCEIRTESRHIEFAAAVNHEYDPTVLEFYAQPYQLNLEHL